MRRRKKETAGHTPSFRESAPLDLREIPPPPEMLAGLINAANDYLRVYLLGRCSVIVTREHGTWHLSIDGRVRYPTWIEISTAWYRTIPGADRLVGALMLPPLDQYVNANEYCMQVMQIPEMP